MCFSTATKNLFSWNSWLRFPDIKISEPSTNIGGEKDSLINSNCFMNTLKECVLLSALHICSDHSCIIDSPSRLKNKKL